MNTRDARLQISPTLAISTRFPVRLEAWVHIIPFVFGRMAASMSSYRILPSLSALTMVSSTPFSLILYRGRSTELCSSMVVITWSPGEKMPWTAMFRLAVELAVNAT